MSGSTLTDVVFTTSDAGRSWQQAKTALEPDGVNSLELYEVSYPDIQHARAVGAMKPYGSAPDGRGAFLKTDDGGATWQRLPTNSDNALRGVSFVDANTGWVVGERGAILHTTDSGTTWKLQGEREDTTDHRGVFFLDKGRGWIVGTRGDIHRTTNGGETWEQRDAGTTADLVSVRFQDERQGYVLADDGQLLRTTDGGDSWRRVTEGVPGNVKAFTLRPDGVPLVAGADGQFAMLQAQESGSGVAGVNASGASPGASPSPGADVAAAQPTPGEKSVRERVRELPFTADRLIGLLGILVVLGMCYLASNNRAAIEWRLVVVGLGLQVIIAVLILKTDTGYAVFDWLGQRINDLLTFSNEGAKFVFGRLVDTTYLDAVTPAGGDAGGVERQVRFYLRVHDYGDDHLRLSLVLDSLSPRRDAARGLRTCVGNAADDEIHLRRGSSDGRGGGLHGADGSAFDHRALHPASDEIRTPRNDDRRHGHGFGRHTRRLCQLRH
jgi:photosystem II stability/assembly factor-like uncharacterized protein